MANRDTRFLIKRSNVPGKIPTNGDLLLGELGLNTADAILYTSGTTANTILPIGWDRVARTGDTMTGGLFTPYLSATTVSATTYLNLPTDIYVTGGTYNNGSATFTNNTGGTFNVSGFAIGGGGGQVFYLNLSQSQNGNRLLSTTASTASEQTSGVTIGDGVTSTIASFQSQPLNIILLPGGVWSFYLHSYKQNNNAAFSIFVEVYKRTSGGTETLLFTTDPTPVTTNSPNPSMQLTDGYFSGTSLNVTDSVIARVRATNTGNQSHSITLVTEGSQHYSYAVSTIPTQQGLTCETLSGCSVIQTIESNLTNKLNKSGDTMTGTLFLPSISATTYQNLPQDVFVTGGTFNAGTTIFTNNTGGTFSVTGYTTGGGGTFTGGTVTGATNFTGGLTANTISATTYYNLPIDVYTTGGTRVDSSLIFTNNTGGTFTVTGVTPSLQEVYTASTAPRITTNNTLGSLRIRGGTGSDSDNNFIIENNIGDVTSYWSANGDLVLQTISATTYYNLPLDVYVTGGSYNQISGIATFTNNSGGTFTVDGFSTGGGGSFTGGTVTGPTNFLDGLSANTISATTYYNLPIDVYVTGGTYSNGSTTFTNITGGTFDVTGYYTGSTDVYVTGGTYTEGVTTFTNNTGVTFNVTSTTTYAAGVISGSTGWSSTGTGQINLPNVKVALYNNANNIEPILIYDVASGTTNSGGIPALANNDTNYIVIEYNGGSPIYNVYDNDSIVNDSSVVLFMVVYRADNFIHTLEFGNQGAGLANKLNDRFIMTDRIGYESGLALGLSGSTGIVTSTAGVAWNGPNRQFLDPVNSQDDIFFKSFHSGGTWVYTTTGDTLNNTYYDDGTDIVLATAGKYLTNWYFRGQEINDHLYEVYSTNQYDSVALAQLSTEPALPELITSHAILLGRIIVQVNATTGLTESAFTVPFQPTQVAYHNDLNGIQGGSAGQYYHLNANQYNNIALTNVDNNFSVGQTFNSGITANTISATTVTGDSGLFVSMSATTLSGGTIYGNGSNITNIPVPYGIINAFANFNFLT